jgi:hypothetical protein
MEFGQKWGGRAGQDPVPGCPMDRAIRKRAIDKSCRAGHSFLVDERSTTTSVILRYTALEKYVRKFYHG